VATVRRRTFPLVPRHRLSGIAFGTQRSTRRGQGAEVAGSRPYVPGDRIAWIDWKASARISAARNQDEFVVREYFAEEAPRVIIVHDRRPAMGLYPAAFQWLSKPAAVREAATVIVASALATRGVIGCSDFAGEPVWIPPHGRVQRPREPTAFDAPEDTLVRALEHLSRLRADVPSGSFVFVLSDFLAPPPDECWLRARARRWDVVPVIVQDPLWEQSFPDLHGLVVPVADPATGSVTPVRLTARDVRARRTANEARLAALLARFRELRLDPVLLGTSDPATIDAEFGAWAARRRLLRERSR
jgi:uncharacterized protein (DUF58 family)